MVTVDVRATLSPAQALALHRVLDRQLEAIRYVERREARNIPPEICQQKEAISEFLQALEAAMGAAQQTEGVKGS